MFRAAQRLFAAWSLLAVMAVVATPRGFLHHCGPYDGMHQEHSDGTTLGNACAICDAALPVAVADEIPLPRLTAQVFGKVEAPAIANLALGHVDRCADRGPPALV